MYRKLLLSIIIVLITTSIHAQFPVHEKSYVSPTEPEVKEKLEKWQDQKFGMLIYWGLSSANNISKLKQTEEDWTPSNPTLDYGEYQKWYFDRKDEFNPINFNPEQWAKAGKEAGMNYMIFMAKHHDGFCMWDTKTTDFAITNKVFKSNHNENIAKYILEAFRKENYMLGLYFSKPDWQTQYYWWSQYNINYKIAQTQYRWDIYKQFTHNQINELTSTLGAIDILRFDGDEIPLNQESSQYDIDMPKITTIVRKSQPGLLIVDPTEQGGLYENYQTYENSIPSKQLRNPWESTITLGENWKYTPNAKYKSSNQIIHTLIEIVAKGGNLLLGIVPEPDGTLSDTVVERLKDIGKWAEKNSASISNTRITEHYNDGKTWFTQSKDAKTLYAITCFEENATIPSTVQWKGNIPKNRSKIRLLYTGKKVTYKVNNNVVTVTLPEDLPKDIPALAFSYAK